VVGLNDGAGARIQEGVVSLASYGGIFHRNVLASGVIPQISVIMGPCAGGAVYSPAMTDFIFMVRRDLHMFITGPDVVKTVTGEEVTLEELGGADEPLVEVGCCHLRRPRREGRARRRALPLSFLPSNNLEDRRRSGHRRPPRPACPSCATIIPDSANQPYDMRRSSRRSSTTASSSSTSPAGPQHRLRLRRVGGQSVGIVGNQPRCYAGVLDIESSEKAARFVRTCDAFNIPLLTFVDVPGFLPGVDQEYNGIIRHGAKLLYAYCEATVPRIQVITRKAYGGAYVVMNSKSIGADLAYAWPSAELAVMGPQGAVEIVYRRELQQAADPVAPSRRAGGRVHREVRQPVQRRRAWLHRRRHRPGRDPPEDRRRLRMLRIPSAKSCRPASTATCRCEVKRCAVRSTVWTSARPFALSPATRPIPR
jgi:acetyl-CoA carboxylase carboxyltransferase component